MEKRNIATLLFAVCFAAFGFSSHVIFAQQSGSGRPVRPTPTPIQLPSLSPEAMLRRGNENYAKKEYEMAFNNYAACFRSDSQASHCAYNMGLARKGQGRFADAIRHYDDAIRLRPDWAEPYRERGIAYSKMLNWTKCIDDISTALSKGDKTESVYTGRAECRRWLGQHKDAVDDLTAAIAISPRVTSLNSRAYMLDQLGRHAEAFADLDRTKNVQGTGFEQHRLRGEVALKIGKYDDAVKAFDQAIATAPPLRPGQPKGASALPDLYFKKGQTLGKNGLAALAFNAYTQSLQQNNSVEVRKARDGVYTLLTPSEKAAADIKLGRKPSPTAKPPGTVAKTRPTPTRPKQVPAQNPKPTPATVQKTSVPKQQAIPEVATLTDGYYMAAEAEKAGNHTLVIGIVDRSLPLLAMRAKNEPTDELMIGVYIDLLTQRAKAYAALHKHKESDTDFEAAVDASTSGTLRYMHASNSANKESETGSIMAGIKTSSGVRVCRQGLTSALAWADAVKFSRPGTNADNFKALIKAMTVREVCSKIYIMDGDNNLRVSQVLITSRTKYLNAALEAFNEAINMAPREKMAYERRAKLHRLLGRNDLAAADEAKLRELSASPPK